MGNVIGKGKTFSAGAIMIALGVLGFFHAVPDAVHVSLTPIECITTGLATIGLGSKLQSLIAVFGGASK